MPDAVYSSGRVTQSQGRRMPKNYSSSKPPSCSKQVNQPAQEQQQQIELSHFSSRAEIGQAYIMGKICKC